MADILQIRFGGLGGQGIVLMGVVLGDAAVRDGLWAAGANSYGAQARGSACRSEVILSRRPIDFPHVLVADILVVMSQQAYEGFLTQLHPDGVVIYDHPQVRPRSQDQTFHLAVPATQAAVADLGNGQVANLLLLASLVPLTGMVSRVALRAAMEAHVSTHLREINQRALEMGYAMGEKARGGVGDRFIWNRRPGGRRPGQ